MKKKSHIKYLFLSLPEKDKTYDNLRIMFKLDPETADKFFEEFKLFESQLKVKKIKEYLRKYKNTNYIELLKLIKELNIKSIKL